MSRANSRFFPFCPNRQVIPTILVTIVAGQGLVVDTVSPALGKGDNMIVCGRLCTKRPATPVAAWIVLQQTLPYVFVEVTAPASSPFYLPLVHWIESSEDCVIDCDFVPYACISGIDVKGGSVLCGRVEIDAVSTSSNLPMQ